MIKLIVLAMVPCVLAAASVYEGFGYPTGDPLGGQNGGTGFTAPWDGNGLGVAIAQGLTFGNLSTTPGAALSDAPGSQVAFYFRPLVDTFGVDNTTVYLSFLLRPEAGFGFYGGVNFGVFIGKSGITSTYGIEGPTNDISSTSTVATAGDTVLLVLRADFLPGNDRFSLFVNPTPGGAEPLTPDAIKTNVDAGTFSEIFVNNAGSYTTDELRIGDTFASVTAVSAPEPGELVLTGLALALMLSRTTWRSRRG